MNCEELLASGDDAAIREHAKGCEACKSIALLMSARSAPLPAGAFDALMKRVSGCDAILESGNDIAIRAHAVECEGCRSVELLMSAKRHPVPAGAWAEHLRRRHARPRLGWFVAAAAALLVASVAGVATWTHKVEPPPVMIMVYDVPEGSGLGEEGVPE